MRTPLRLKPRAENDGREAEPPEYECTPPEAECGALKAWPPPKLPCETIPPWPPAEACPPPRCAESGIDATKTTNTATKTGRCIPLIICLTQAGQSRNRYLRKSELGQYSNRNPPSLSLLCLVVSRFLWLYSVFCGRFGRVFRVFALRLRRSRLRLGAFFRFRLGWRRGHRSDNCRSRGCRRTFALAFRRFALLPRHCRRRRSRSCLRSTPAPRWWRRRRWRRRKRLQEF